RYGENRTALYSYIICNDLGGRYFICWVGSIPGHEKVRVCYATENIACCHEVGASIFNCCRIFSHCYRSFIRSCFWTINTLGNYFREFLWSKMACCVSSRCFHLVLGNVCRFFANETSIPNRLLLDRS